ncbi:MAG: hypothetical protein GVY24_02810 [Planctomycetes bacterium]|nr:hypothetical protein [Planctomycetota bacterium]
MINELTDFGMPVADANTLKNRRAKQYELTISEHGVSFYFEDGRCSLVSVFPVEMDGRPVWPG